MMGVGELIEKYARPRNRDWKETERILRRDFAARWVRSRRGHNEEADHRLSRPEDIVAILQPDHGGIFVAGVRIWHTASPPASDKSALTSKADFPARVRGHLLRYA